MSDLGRHRRAGRHQIILQNRPGCSQQHRLARVERRFGVQSQARCADARNALTLKMVVGNARKLRTIARKALTFKTVANTQDRHSRPAQAASGIQRYKRQCLDSRTLAARDSGMTAREASSFQPAQAGWNPGKTNHNNLIKLFSQPQNEGEKTSTCPLLYCRPLR